MKSGLMILAILSLSSATVPTAFFNGFVAGLEANPNSVGVCGNELFSLTKGLATLQQDLIAVLEMSQGGFNQIVKDFKDFEATVRSFSTNCNFANLIVGLNKFTTDVGRSEIITQYIKNVGKIDTLMNNVHQCENDLYLCGESLGEVLNILTGATLNSKLKLRSDAQVSPFSIIELYLSSFLNYLSTSATTPLCKGNVFRLLPSISNVINNLSNKQEDLKNLWYASVEATVISTCWSTDWRKTPATGFFKLFSVLLDLKAWKLSYFMNTADMNKYIGQLGACNDDFAACGNALNSLAVLIAPWIDYK